MRTFHTIQRRKRARLEPNTTLIWDFETTPMYPYVRVVYSGYPVRVTLGPPNSESYLYNRTRAKDEVLIMTPDDGPWQLRVTNHSESTEVLDIKIHLFSEPDEPEVEQPKWFWAVYASITISSTLLIAVLLRILGLW